MSAASMASQQLNATTGSSADPAQASPELKATRAEPISKADEVKFRTVCGIYGVEKETIDQCATYLTSRDANLWGELTDQENKTGQLAAVDHASPTGSKRNAPTISGPPPKKARKDGTGPLQPPQGDNKVLEPLEAIKLLVTDVITDKHWGICSFDVKYKRGRKTLVIIKEDEEESKDSFLTKLREEVEDTDTLISCTLSVRVKNMIVEVDDDDKEELSLKLNFEKNYTPRTLKTKYNVEFMDAFDVEKLAKAIQRTTNEENKTFLEQFISTEPSIDDSFFDTNARNHSKSKVLVVAGESGSGKTTFAKQGIHKLFGKLVLYRSVSNDDFKSFNEEKKTDFGNEARVDKTSDHFQVCRWMNECILAAPPRKKPADETADETADRTGWADRLYAAYSQLQKDRNTSAQEFFQHVFEPKKMDQLNDHEQYIGWWSATPDKRAKATFDELVIVLDEIGRDLRLVSGLIDVARGMLLKNIIDPQKAKRCTLVLCGTSLDALRYDESSTIPMISTDPDKSKVVVMQTPQLDKLGAELSEPIRKGIYSSILSTNARMLMEGVVPLLKSPFVSLELKGDELTQNRQKVGSYRGMMSYPLRLYPTLNALSNLSSAKMKEKIAEAFKYLWSVSLIEGKNYGLPDSEWQVPAMDSNIFQYGIATMNPSETSKALCFMASTGLAVPVLPKGGFAFNDMVALHMARLWQVFGFHVCEMELETAWPLTLHNKKESKERREEAEDNIELLQSVNMKKAIEHLGSNKKSVVILRNTVLDSQGSDIFMAERNGKSHTLYVIKCKNMIGLPDTLVDQSLLHSLGISGLIDGYDVGGMSTANDNTTIKNAEETLDVAYCGAAIQKLVDCLKQEGQEEWFVKRILADPHRTPQTIESVYHWTGEFFEPTVRATTNPADTARR